jgi:hypothetical protein
MPDPTTYDEPVQQKGIIPPRRARQIAFAVVTITLVACTLTALLAIWDCVARDSLWRSLATVTIVLVATGLFTVVNEHFGKG